MTPKEIRKLERTAENSKLDAEAVDAMEQLRTINISYHWCPDWDYMVICDTHHEWESCTCLRLKEKIALMREPGKSLDV